MQIREFLYNHGVISFKKISSPEPVVEHIHQSIAEKLSAGRSVLWLLSGGSFIPVEVATAKKLSSHQNLDHLTVTLTDERYGPAGHPESNWQKLLTAGFSLTGARLKPILNGKGHYETVLEFRDFIAKTLASDVYKLACVGVGSDGHTLGVLKHSSVVDSSEQVVAYRGADFDRITTTLGTLKLLDEVVVYMVGKEKWSLIDQLADQSIPFDEQPAQALKQAKKVTVYNDYYDSLRSS